MHTGKGTAFCCYRREHGYGIMSVCGFDTGKMWQTLHYCLINSLELLLLLMEPKVWHQWAQAQGINHDWSKPIMIIAFPFARYKLSIILQLREWPYNLFLVKGT